MRFRFGGQRFEADSERTVLPTNATVTATVTATAIGAAATTTERRVRLVAAGVV